MDPGAGRWAGGFRALLPSRAGIRRARLPGPFDLIFVDEAHEYDFVVRDTQNALRNLAPNGTIVWHDYGQIPDVSRAVDELPRELGCHAITGTRLAVTTAS